MAISSNESANLAFANQIKVALGGYLNYVSYNITGEVSVPGSNTHEGVDVTIRKGLTAWSDLISSDSAAIQSAHSAISSLDENMKAKMLGLG